MYTGKIMKFLCNKYALFCFFMWSFVLLVYYAANESAILPFGHSFSIISAQFHNRNETAQVAGGQTGEAVVKSRQECIHPQLKVNDPVMMKHFKTYKPISCPGIAPPVCLFIRVCSSSFVSLSVCQSFRRCPSVHPLLCVCQSSCLLVYSLIVCLSICRRGFKGATTLDNFPFLWHKMKSLGYLTSWCNGSPLAAPFNWRMLGFSEKPTDFYSRPFYLYVHGDKKLPSPKICLGSRTQSQVWLNYFKDIFQMYKNKRKFLFHFITEFSHDDNNLMSLMDDDIQKLVEFLYEGNYLNNTLLILMGDHGARYSFIRSTWSGKLEERLPYFSFLFPDWFEKKYPEAIKNLRTNTKRLTTPFDLYETFQDIIHYNESAETNVSKRGISLFQEVPLERSCDHASIAPHWCACLAWKNVSLAENNTKLALQYTLDTINNYTAKYRDDCALLFIANVTMATKMETRQEVLQFKQTDSNGGIYKIDFSAKNKNELELYQLTFQTTPGGGHFEVTVTHDLVHKKFYVSDKEISRINKYGNDPACILEKNKQIRQYCYCNNNIR
ncbi:unnamed protein product [Candidula unifasciata]|uniref:DUF229 domain-containing protein n=1 Tax=Candidula unifasciata TaxID=100452 RepID=A0A8S3YW25_9EUPU|nr:unnamed protein product [Candidula unifasciata]